jgi:hypothetical protein
MRLIRKSRHLRIMLSRVNLRQLLRISLLTESARLIDLCRLMGFLRHIDLQTSEPKLRGHCRRIQLLRPTGVLQKDWLPLAPVIQLLPIHMALAPPVLMVQPRRNDLLHPVGSAHLTVLQGEHLLIQLRLLMSLL